MRRKLVMVLKTTSWMFLMCREVDCGSPIGLKVRMRDVSERRRSGSAL